jgi:prophage regulatory protein
MRMAETCRLTGLSKSSILRSERNGDFPRRVTLGLRSVGYRRKEVLAWIASRKEAGRQAFSLPDHGVEPASASRLLARF